MNKNSKIWITNSAPINIAVIKYWGKRDEIQILPINSSISCTINQHQIKTVTTIMASENFEKDRIWLNGKYLFFLTINNINNNFL